MKMTQQQYKDYTDQKAQKSSLIKNCVLAFLIGGGICAIGQFIKRLYMGWGLEDKAASTALSATLIIIAAILTGLGLYGKLAQTGGAGTLVPITGFSNAMTAAAMEFRTEGLITGIGVKMFSITGAVIVYGISASIIYGVIYYIVRAVSKV